MGLLNLLKKGASRFGFSGTTPNIMSSAVPSSKLHHTYSLNGDPVINGKGQPSQLDLDGKLPTQYLDNLPK